jgi:predicted nucleic acid-binding protein
MIIVDTGVLFAAADRDDPDHSLSGQVLLDHIGAMVVPVPVVIETSWLIESRLGSKAEAAFLHAVAAGELARLDLGTSDWQRVAELVEQYADLGLGVVDASVIAAAERLSTTTVATLNHRDFSGRTTEPLPRAGHHSLTLAPERATRRAPAGPGTHL